FHVSLTHPRKREAVMVRRHSAPAEFAATPELIEEVRDLSKPLRTPTDLKPLLDRVGNARVVLLGEASHGTHEFYTWRAEITKRLVTQHGFNFVAVEGDWPDCYRVNRFLKGYPGSANSAQAALDSFRRWPTWMWANEEVRDLVTWM